MSTLEVNNITPQSGSSITIGGSGDTVSLGSGATQSGFGGTNTPAFLVYNVGTQTIGSGVNTKLTFNTELYDTDSAVSSSTFTVPSGKGGKYFLAGGFRINGGGTGTSAQIHFYVNGSVVFHRVGRLVGNYNETFDSAITYTLSAGDTVELYTKQDFGSNIDYSSESGEKRQYFTGFKLVE
jgi:hypothetical protein